EAGGVGREVETAADPPGSVTAARGATGAGAAGAGPGSAQPAGPGTGNLSPELRPALALQRGPPGPAPPARGGSRAPAPGGARTAGGRLARPRGRAPPRRRGERNSGAPRLGEPDGHRLLAGSGSVLPLPDVLHLLLHEFARRRAGRLAAAE